MSFRTLSKSTISSHTPHSVSKQSLLSYKVRRMVRTSPVTAAVQSKILSV